ncbi:zinc transporter [Demequina iriomotensis]|uniref:zinc transporter n=1 Tax=Demequina iriomotensis TaxID=1536641 RepID=UPI0012E011ED|nr:zinc transporter [Demequina iriomotensis]
MAEDEACSPNAGGTFACPAGMTPILPLWSRTLVDGAWTDWALETWYSCPSESELMALIEHEWTTLHLDSPVVTLQPGTGQVLATVPTIAYADGDVRSHSAVLLGAQVDIRATPATYTWDWGDGESTTTSDPGAPYPHETVSHAYGRALDAATVTLETVWTGQYRVAGGTWLDFDASVATDSAGITLEVLHPRVYLVDGPLTAS